MTNCVSKMTEPEVSLSVAVYYIERGDVVGDVIVSLDGAHMRVKGSVYFDVPLFMRGKGYEKVENDAPKREVYQNKAHSSRVIVERKSGQGDVVFSAKDGRSFFVESKKFKGGNSPEYPAMREAIGQLMTGQCPHDSIPVVAVPYTDTSKKLAEKWLENSNRLGEAGVCFMLVKPDGSVAFVSAK